MRGLIPSASRTSRSGVRGTTLRRLNLSWSSAKSNGAGADNRRGRSNMLFLVEGTPWKTPRSSRPNRVSPPVEFEKTVFFDWAASALFGDGLCPLVIC
jgi:hypothetical protein